jgi:hypothetical protein
MTNHAEGFPVRVVRTTYGEHKPSARPPPPKLGAVTGPILDSKICRWPGLRVGRIAHCRDAQRNDLKTLKSVLVSSSRLVR